ncbi:MAG: hypothetical protein COA39_010500 [Sulfurimonas sp.]|nr:hypothetical protein [Sulfurimonas sp.]
MCMPHGSGGSKSNAFIKEVSQDQFKKGDPNFVDERISLHEPKIKKSFFSVLLD